jgi:hypothetical protein
MKKALLLTAVTITVATLGVALAPRQSRATEAQLDQAAVDAQIDARLHALLGRMRAQTREGSSDGQLAVRW